ncbi:hypothetical protein GP486_003764, partial [Trichoglossum hirsutum]
MVVERRSPTRHSPQGQQQQQSPHRSPSPRKPLHERSDSQSNERSQRSSPERGHESDASDASDADPDTKHVDEEAQRFYSASPFPTRPSQVLSPKGFNRQGYAVPKLPESQQERVSDAGPAFPHPNSAYSPTSSPPFDLFDDESLKPAHLSPRPKHKGKGKERERETGTLRSVNASDSSQGDAARFRADIASLPKPSGRHGPPYHGAERAASGQPSPSSHLLPPRAYRSAMRDEAATGLGISHPHHVVHAPEPPTNAVAGLAQSRSPTLSAFAPADSSGAAKSHRSRSSFSPSRSSDAADAAKGPQYSPFPSAQTSLRRRSSSVTTPPPRANPERSTDSLASASVASQASSSHRSILVRAVPSDDALKAAAAGGAAIQYPTVRPPSAQGSWAGSSITIPKRPRMTERTSPRLHQWNAQPPTPQSASVRTSQQTYPGLTSPRHVSPTNTEPRDSSSMSFVVAKFPSDSALNTMQRQFASSQRDVTGSTIRVVYESDEYGDTVRDLRSPVTESPRFAESPRNTGSDLHRTDSTSGSSFVSGGIPMWARYFHRRGRDQESAATNKNAQGHNANRFQRIYYGRGGPDSLGASGSSIGGGDDSRPSTLSRTAGNQPPGILRTRGRADSDMEITELPPNVEVEVTGPPRSRSGGEWTPRLHQDRRAKTMS